MHQSVATIDSPQFLNLQPLDINPLMSKCEIKVLYVGANRNRSFITEEVAAEMGKTLRGAPIVGYYRKNKEDFTDHGEKVIIDDEGVKFECQTIPYGFVSPDAKVWFQDFEDNDGMGNTVTRKYLMTTGYLWTGQFPESSLPVEQGRPQSMELYEDSVKGSWQTNYDKGMDFFIINDAIIQKICILGDDVEPCFEGASVTAPDVSTKFTLDDKFRHTLYSMMQELKSALNGGGQQMENLENTVTVEEPAVNFTQEDAATEVDENKDTSVPADFVKKDEEEKKPTEEEKSSDEGDEEKDSKDSSDDKEDDDDEDDKNKKDQKYELLESKYEALQAAYQTLQAQCADLIDFKKSIDNQRKDELIAEFYMLSDDDKADVIRNKQKYSLDEIKAKLAIICFDRKVSFNPSEQKKEEEVVTYSLNNNENNSQPEWVRAVKEQETLLGY